MFNLTNGYYTPKTTIFTEKEGLTYGTKKQVCK